MGNIRTRKFIIKSKKKDPDFEIKATSKEALKRGIINTIEDNIDPNKTYLIHNGKVKEISPKSRYLLDMLILDK